MFYRILLASLISMLATGCKQRSPSGPTGLAGETEAKEILPEVCVGIAGEVSDDKENHTLVFETPSEKEKGVYFIAKSLRHFRGLELMVKDSYAHQIALCVNKKSEGEPTYEVVALNIGTSRDLLQPKEKRFPQTDPTRPHRVSKFEISSEGGIKAVVDNFKFACPGKYTFWNQGEKGLYDGVQIIGFLMDDYKKGMSQKRLEWMRKTLCVSVDKQY